MNKKELLERANDPRYISGIYNYCDRWCERCPLAGRCLQYAIEDDRSRQAGRSADINESFWDSIQDSLEMALSLLTDLADEFGIDLEAIEVEDDLHLDNKEHLLSHVAHRYIETVDGWFDRNRLRIAEELAERREAPLLKVVRQEVDEPQILLAEAVEVVQYYKYLIPVKLERALNGREDEEPFGNDGFPKDSDGSAKVALIAVDRSISAWGVLLSHLPEQKKDLLDPLRHLKQIRGISEREFPDARSFVRPGFDDEP